MAVGSWELGVSCFINHYLLSTIHYPPTTNHQPPTTNDPSGEPVTCASVTKSAVRASPPTTNHQLPATN
ncbi:MAG: hypothetical protein ACHBN1_38075 [Heteroscytonema crispum UTEX LB 1556]